MSAERDPLEELLARVSDGGTVDWERARSASEDPGTRARVARLEELARIAEFSRLAQRDAAPPEPDGEPRRWGPLLLLESIGRGATGEVWRAWDPQLQRELAVKMLRVEAASHGAGASLLAEGQALARVRHPNVVMVHGLEEHDGRLGLRMDLVRGTTLEREIQRRGALGAAEVQPLAAELFGALAAVHAAGVLHRDVKPANLVRGEDGHWVLADFGLGTRDSAARDDRAGVSGTPMFMPPECLDGLAPDERADLYAAGATLLWALTGRPPYASRDLAELRAAARRGPDPAVLAGTDASPALRETILSTLAPHPATPPLRAAAIAARLGAVTGVRRRRVWPALAAAAVLAVVIVLGWGGLRPARHPGAPVAGAAPPTTDAASPYAIDASLLRVDASGERPLANGDRVRPGDRLSLNVRSTRPVWVYVLDGDDRGETYLLFPQPLFDRGNPVAPDSAVRLPGRMGGRESGWTVTSRGGHEHVLIVASPRPVPELESALASLPAPSPDHPVSYARVATSDLERMRGVGGVSPLPESQPHGPAPLFERIRALAGRESDVRGTWVRQVTLDNPLH